MPKVTLEFEMKQTGQVDVKQISQAVEDLGKKASEAATAHTALAEASGRASLSSREMSQAIGAISEAFGQVNPTIAMASIHASRFMSSLQDVSLSGKITALTVVGLGAAAAATIAQFMEIEKVQARMAEINRTIASLDLSGLDSQLLKTSIGLETLNRQTDSWTGTFIVGLRNIYALLPGVPNEIEAASAEMEKLRAGLEQVLPFYEKLEAAKHAQAMAGLESANLQAYTQNLLTIAQLPLGSENWYSAQMTKLIQAQAAAAQQVAFQQRQKEFMEASVRGTLDIESDAIVQRYNEALGQIRAKTALDMEQLQGRVTSLGKAIGDSFAKVYGIDLKYTSDVAAAWSSLVEMKRTLADQEAAWTVNEYDKQIAAVDKWERDSIAKIDEKLGHTREAEGLEEQIVEAASGRKAQIAADWTKKVEDALAHQVDSFEEAYNLMGKQVTITQDDIDASGAKGAQEAKSKYDQDVQNFVNAQVYKTGIYRDEQTKQRDKVIAWYDWLEQQRQREIQREKTEALMRMNAADGYFDKFRDALGYQVTDFRSANDRMLDITKGFAQAASTGLDDFFFNVVTGQFSKLSDVASQFGQALVRIATQQLAIATMSGLFGSGGLFGPTGTGIGTGTALAAALGLPANASSDLIQAELAALATGGPAGASSGGGAGPLTGGGILGPLSNILSLGRAGYAGITGGMAGGIQGAVEKIIGLSPGTLNALFGPSVSEQVAGAIADSLLASGTAGAGLTSEAISGAVADSLAASGTGGEGFLASLGLNAGNAGPIGFGIAALTGLGFGIASMFSPATSSEGSVSAANLAAYLTLGMGPGTPIDALRRIGAGADIASVIASDPSTLDPGQMYSAAVAAESQGIVPAGTADRLYVYSIAEVATPSNGMTQAQLNAYNTDMQSGSGMATGGLFNTTGPTRMLVGEAGTETVAVLRNPRPGEIGGGGADHEQTATQHFHLNFDLRGGIMGDRLPENTLHAIIAGISRYGRSRISSGGHLFPTHGR